MTIQTNPPTLPFSPMAGSPKLDDLFNIFKKQIMLDLNCHAVGTIQSFDSDNQTAQVSFNYTKTYFVRNESTKQYQQNEQILPILQQVPIIFLNGGSFSLTFPIIQGDQCLVFFNDRDMDKWYGNETINNDPNSVSPCNTVRLHSSADAIAIVGLHPLSYQIPNYDTAHALLQNGATQVGISATQARIANAATTLGAAIAQVTTALENLGTALAAATSSTGDTGLQSAINSAGSALNSAITTAASALSNLLE